jgi:hypothetical protein
MKIHTDEAQPKNNIVEEAQARPKGHGPDRQPEPSLDPDGMHKGSFSPHKSTPRN